jgi:uncharacterized protein YfkK (UPF0435 family)
MNTFNVFLLFFIVYYSSACLGSIIETLPGIKLNNKDILSESLNNFEGSSEEDHFDLTNKIAFLPSKRSQTTRHLQIRVKPEHIFETDATSREHLININNAEVALEDSSKLIAALLAKYEKLNVEEEQYSHSKNFNDLNDIKRLLQYKRTFSLNEYLQKKRGYYTRPCLMNVISCYYHGK